MKKLTSIVVVIFLISILKAFSYGQGDSAAVNPNHPPIERDERLSRRFPHSKNEMDFTEKRDILSERMEHHKGERAGAQKQSLSNDKEPEWVSHYALGLALAYDVATDMAVDNIGNVYVTGYSPELPFGVDYFTAKYDASGNPIWSVRYDYNGDDFANAIAVDGSGNIYVTGSSYNSDSDIKDDWDYATVKYNSEGQEQWVARYDGPENSYDKATAIAVDGSGNVYVTGYSKGSDTYYDYATVKYNSSGEEQWVARYNGPGNYYDYAHAIAIDGSGNVYVTGESRGSGTFDDYATVKYNSSGQEQWVARYNGPGNSGDGANAIAVDGSGNIYVTGSSYNLDLDIKDDWDYATVKYNSEGQEQWVARYNGPGNSSDEANAIAVDGSGNVYVTGYSEGNKWSVYTTIKYSGETGIVDEIINLPSTVYLGNNYPNPFNSSTTIQYTLPRNEYVRLSIYSISGQLVKTIENGVRSVGVHTESWNGTDARGRSATSGIYFYRLEAGGETFVKKMVLMR